jgi:hypothetical protein
MKNKNLLITAIAIFGLATITVAQVPSYVPSNGLVGWYPFTGNANDSSGNNLNASFTGANLTTDRNGNPNSAYDFDYIGAVFSQQNDEIYIPYNSILNVSNITVSAWIYPRTYFWSGNSNDPSSTIIRRFQYTYSNPSGGAWAIDYFADKIQAYVLDVNNNPLVVTYNTPLTLNEWANVSFTYDGSTLNLYLNGQLVSSNSGSIILNVSGNSGISIGESNQANGYWYYVDGVIDDIGIWNRALTQLEVSDLYNGCQLSVNSQPNSETININSNAQFTIGSSDPNASFQWQTNLGVGFQNLNNVGQYSGSTNDTLFVSNVTLSNNNQPFRCIISSGSCSDTSNVGVLTVNNNVGLNEFKQGNLFSVFPNPAQSVINIKADTRLIGNAYSIFDNTGRVILTGKINSENTLIELGNLSGGIYMFSVGENMKQTFKVIKE